jgi:hypothetical protein
VIDTLKLVRRLTDKGMGREQAEAIAEEFDAGMKQSTVTKEDLAVTRADLMTAAISKVKNEMLAWQVKNARRTGESAICASAGSWIRKANCI